MFYLIHCDTHGCVDFNAFVGIADNSNGVMELLFNFHKQNLILTPDLTFENSHYDVQIFSINEVNYNYLLDEINKNEEKILQNYETLGYKPECSQSEYLFVILNNDGKCCDIFDKQFYKKYYSIIKKSKKIIV